MYGTLIGFAGRGEMIPNERTYCDLDPDIVDQWASQSCGSHWQWSDNEIKMAKDMRRQGDRGERRRYLFASLMQTIHMASPMVVSSFTRSDRADGD